MEKSEKRNPFTRMMAIRGMGQVVTVTVGLVALCIVFGILNPSFFSGKNVGNLLRQIAPTLITGIGQSFVLITGNIDLSIGSVVGMSCMLSATMMTKGLNPWAAVVITLACCLLVGIINGELVARCKLPPFIATLGMMKICRSVTQQCMQKASPTVPKAFLKIANARIGGEIILPILYWLALAAILHVVSKHTAFGRQVFAIGSNERTSKLSGVNVRAVKRRVYALMGALVAITAVIQIARIGSMDYANAGSGYEMDAIAAVIIGGTSMSGGRGSVVGSVLGMLILAVMNNLLNLIGVPPFLREAFKGIIVIGAVLLQKKEKAS